MSRKAIVLGAGISGLSSAAYLAKKGFKVEIIEKHSQPGGRLRTFEAEGFTFDMGPSWYWMPDIFERFFESFGHKPSDFYHLKRLDPGYRIFFDKNEKIDIPAKSKELYDLFESIEKGSSKKLKKFLKNSHRKYQLGMNKAVFKPGISLLEYIDPKLLTGFVFSKSFQSLSHYVRNSFKDKRLRTILEFPVLFLGALPDKTPALYSLMNYADLKLGTWYPMGGMSKITDALISICDELNVEITYNLKIDKIDILKDKVIAVHSGHRNFYAEYFISTIDYHHTDKKLLTDKFSNYSEKYWNKRILAPSALLFYMGINKKIPELMHHNLFFDTNFEKHSLEIYKTPKWPESPAFYVSVPSKTDPVVAPDGCENLVVLIPVAPNLEEHGKVREYYFNRVVERIENTCGIKIRENIIFHKSYGHTDFINDYSSYKGNAYGLANTLRQTGPFKPKIYSKKLPNLFYAGQFTVPGPGVPPSLISGELVADQVYKIAGGLKN